MVAFYPSGDMAITCFNSAKIKVFNSNGKFKHIIYTKQDSITCKSYPHGIVINTDGTAFVTDESSLVKVFDTSRKWINQFQTSPPGLSQTASKNSQLTGLAMTYNRNLIVGDNKNMYISIHNQSGEHVKSFKVSIEPWYLSAAPNRDIIVISSWTSGVQIVTCTGQVLHIISSNPISLEMKWWPTGVCFNGDHEFLITDKYNATFHYFSTDGTHLGYGTHGVQTPRDVAVRQDGTILVVEGECIKVFKKK